MTRILLADFYKRMKRMGGQTDGSTDDTDGWQRMGARMTRILLADFYKRMKRMGGQTDGSTDDTDG